jgi:hypothetical protein
MVSVGLRICFTCVHYSVFVSRYWNHLGRKIIENLLKINKYQESQIVVKVYVWIIQFLGPFLVLSGIKQERNGRICIKCER